MTGNGAGLATRAVATPASCSVRSASSAASGSAKTATRSSRRTGHLVPMRGIPPGRRAGSVLALHGLGDGHGGQDLDEEQEERDEHAEAPETDAHLARRRRVVAPGVDRKSVV